ncbi:MAG: hypothetical protein JNL39_03875 [Opitutaceae bacterium]|nr:hypothetical protein [Opitutaceae bacterium]
MRRLAEIAWAATRALGSGAWSFAVWTVWLGLVLLAALQVYILSAREVALPGFVLAALEERAASAGFHVKFGRTTFDLAGHLLAENVGLSLPAFPDPVVTVRTAYVRFDPFLLTIGLVEPREVRLGGVAVSVPAMFSPSGRAEPLIHDLDLTLEPERRGAVVRQLAGRFSNLVLTAHGRLTFSGLAARAERTDSPPAAIGARFPEWCRRGLAAAQALARFESPALDLAFTPSASGATVVDVLALARRARLEAPFAAEARDVAVSTRLLLFGDAAPSQIEVRAAEISVGADAVAQAVEAGVSGRVRLDTADFELREISLSADRVGVHGATATALALRLRPGPLPAFEAAATARIHGAPLAVQATGDAQARRAHARFHGEIAPDLLDVIARRTGADVRRFFDFDTLAIERGEVRIGNDAQLERLTARITLPVARTFGGVTLTEGRVLAELEPGRFRAPEAFARIGENFARGSYEHDLATHRHRFLLAGQLRPLAISGWFRSGWWERFFSQFEFPAAPPAADVDVQGVWRDGRQSGVFVFADAPRTTIRGAELDHVRTRLFIRQGFVDGLETHATRGEGAVDGLFTFTNDPTAGEWRTVDLAFHSTLDLPAVARLVPPAAEAIIRAFALEHSPAATVKGRFAHANAPGGAASKLSIDARTSGDFRYHGFPLRDVAFKAKLDQDSLSIDDAEAALAGGKLRGHARAWGTGPDKRLGFDLALADASLGPLVGAVNGYFAARKGVPPAPPGKFVQEKANVRVALAVSAEGRLDDPFSYRGAGNGALQGAEIGEVPLLGALSGLLKFTALRFTEARGNFKVEGPRLVFPSLTLRGANSAIDGHGSYALDRRELDINAKIFPFQESGNLLKSVVGAVLTPLSNAFEVRLSGSLEKPEWAFANFSATPAPAAPAADPPPATRP